MSTDKEVTAWSLQREFMQAMIKDLVTDLLSHTGASAFCVQLGIDKERYLAVGTRESILKFVSPKSSVDTEERIKIAEYAKEMAKIARAKCHTIPDLVRHAEMMEAISSVVSESLSS